MMFLRHGTFARLGVVERRRKQIIGGVLGLLLVASAVIFAAVNAAGSLNLAYTDESNKGLTGGNITGTLTAEDDSVASNLDRDGKVKLNLEFNLTDDAVEAAKNANAWTYDLSDVVSDNTFISSIDDIDTNNARDIIKDNTVIASYTASNNIITIVPKTTQGGDPISWWDDHATDVRFALSVTLNLDKVGVGVQDSNSIALPGTATLSNRSGNSTNTMYYKAPHVAVYQGVHDNNSFMFKYAPSETQMIGVDEDNGHYYATYNTNFHINAYVPDLKLTIALTGDHGLLSNDIVMKTCTKDNCISGSGVTTIKISNDYVNDIDNKTAEIDMSGFLYDYCEVGGHDCTAAGIYGYTLNDAMTSNNANHSDFYLQYRSELGINDPAGNGKVYAVSVEIEGGNGALSATGDTRFVVGIPGSKTGTCVDGSSELNGSVSCNDDGDGNVYIDYVIKVGSMGSNLSNATVIDYITDNQALVGDITLTSPSQVSSTIQHSNTCASADDDECIVSGAIDSNYSADAQKLFSHAFSSGDVGEWTISYRTRVVTESGATSKDIDNSIKLKIGETIIDVQDGSYENAWPKHYEFANLPHIAISDDILARETQDTKYWLVKVYGDDTYNDIAVVNQLDYDRRGYSIGSVESSIVSATKTANNVVSPISENTDYTLTKNYGNLTILIPTLNAGEVYSFVVKAQADENFKLAYANRNIPIRAKSCRSTRSGNETIEECSAQIAKTIMNSSVELMTKEVQEVDNVFYWKQDKAQHDPGGSDYVEDTRTGYIWTVTLNPNASSDTDQNSFWREGAENYNPIFTDEIPAGMYLTHRTGANGEPEPECPTEGNCDASVDINQSKYSTVINVTHYMPTSVGANEYTLSNVPVTVTNGMIDPIDLGRLFESYCASLGYSGDSAMDCTGIKNTTYIITYATTLTDDIYYDYGNKYSFQGQAKLYESNGGATRANAVGAVTYLNFVAIEKNDLTVTNLDSINKITYEIVVNKDGYNFLNDGEPYVQGVSRPKLKITDQISSDVNILAEPFSATNLDSDVSANNNLSSLTDSVICTDLNDTIVSDCDFKYDSASRTLTAWIPDGYTRKIWYSVTVANPVPNEYAEYANTATMTVGAKNYSGSTTRGHTASSGANYASVNGTMTIKKLNAEDSSEAVQGAEFKLARVAYDLSTGAITGETVIDLDVSDPNSTNGVTDSNGLIELSALCGFSTATPDPNSDCPSGGQLYYLQEVSAPAPYSAADNGTKHYFVLYDEEATDAATEANRAVARQAAALVEENGSNNATVEIFKPGYEWVVTNVKQSATTLAIENKVTGNMARVEDEFTINMSATDYAGAPLEGTYEYCAYDINNPVDSLTCLDEELEFTDGVSEDIELGHNKGIILYGLYTGGTYEITEASTADYDVSYVCTDRTGEGCASATSNTGTLVKDANTGTYPTLANVGQRVTLKNDSSSTVTGVSEKKPSVAIAVVFGGAVAALGLVVARKFRQ